MEVPVLNVNNVDPDQTPRSAVSDLGLDDDLVFYVLFNII